MQLLKNNFFNISLQQKLLFYSLFITIISITTLFFLSQNLVIDLIVQEQTQYENNYLQMKGEMVSNFFEETEGNLHQIYNNNIIRNRLTKNYLSEDYNYIYDSINVITDEIEGNLFQQNYIDKIVLLGSNNFSYYYSWGEGGHFISKNFKFENFNSNLLLENQEEGLPFYFSKQINKFNNYNRNILNLLKNKIVYFRRIRDFENDVKGIIIISFHKEFISDLFYKKSNKKTIRVYDYNSNLIWSNNSSIQARFKKEGLVTVNRNKILRISKKLNIYGFKIISLIPLSLVVKEVTNIRKYFIVSGVLCMLAVFISSLIFSGKITIPINNLAGEISRGLNKAPLNKQSTGEFFGKMKIKHKILLYFFITIIIPYLLFGSLLFYNYYNIYEKKVKELITSNVTLAQQNLNYNLQKIDKLTKHISYSSKIQGFLNKKKKIVRESYKTINIYPNLKKSNLLAMSLYTLTGDNIYSSIYFDTFPVTSINNNFFDIMKNSDGKLKLLKVKNGLYFKPSIAFAREIYSIQNQNFQELIGFSVFYLEQDIFKSLYYSLKWENKTYFLIMDQNGNTLSTDVDIPVQRDDFISLIRGNKGDHLNYRGKKYLFTQSITDPMQLKIIGLIPYDQITDKILPLIKTNLIYLLLCSLFLIGVSSLISFNTNKRLNRLGKAMEKVKKEENFNVKVNDKGGDEISLLTCQFNSMVDKLKELIKENYEVKIHEKELKFLEKEAQLNALQQQINPHFLYNTLEAIKWMAYKKGAQDISEMATALGKFFRGSITKTNTFVTVEEEINHLKNYIYIQNLRYRNKFKTIIDIEEKTEKYKLPKLILQPIVENCIIHGLENLENGGEIIVKSFVKKDMIYFHIKDTGVGISQDKLQAIREKLKNGDDVRKSNKSSIGLKNVYKRLKLYFGENSSFKIKSKQGTGTLIIISMPIIY